MRVLVTGGAGFIGSHLCRRLLEQGDEVYCLDIFYSSARRNIADLESDPHFHFLEQDIEEPIDLKVDRIYNMACPASPVHYQRDPVKTARTSVLGAINMLELAKRNNCRILQTSTSEIYGNPLTHPQKESYWGNVNTIGLRSCYDEGKRMSETLFFDYHRQYGVDIRVVRIFNTYGPYMAENDGRVVSNFIVQALRGDDITIYGDGSQTRSFCYVDDTVEALMRMMEGDYIGPVNIGNPDERTVKELAEKIVEMTSSSSKIVYKGLPSDDPVRRKPDISLAKEKLHWQPVVPLETGLRNTIEYFKKTI
ncbi:MAG: SDR family oxidoreductase [Erysipelotrichaceae bacterium]|nr:SDR family oxidoreductase [Erysipelotrichaceae bacterium]